MRRLLLSSILVVLCAAAVRAQEQGSGPILFQRVTASESHIAFSYAGDIWIVNRSGGEARRLTTDPAEEDFPLFSPDGKNLAFSRTTGGDYDIFVMPASGGEARRLTYYPKLDVARGWSADGKNILFVSYRNEEGTYRLYTMAVDGVFPTMLRLPEAHNGSLSPDGASIAYTPYDYFSADWRYYRGGMLSHLQIARLSDGQVEKLPAGEFNDKNPMWVGDKIYFISDRTATFNLYCYDTKTRQTKQLTSFEKYGIRWASAAPGAICFWRDGRIYLFDIESSQARAVDIRVSADGSQMKPRAVNAARSIEYASLSPAGDQIIFSARGEALVFDHGKNETRNLTQTPGAADRYAVISPDGRWVAYFSDESGEYHLHIGPASGQGAVKKISIESTPSFYREPTWSPDSKKLAFSDKRLAIWYADIERGTARRIDQSTYSDQDLFYPSWSPDGRWLAYCKAHRNRIRTVYIHDTQSGRSHQVTDGVIHAEHPVFDRNGKYLYFTASGNAGASEFGWGVLSGIMARPLVTRTLAAIVLKESEPSPLLLNGQPNAEAKPGEAASQVHIDFEDIERRIISLPIAPRDYAELAAGRPGEVYALVTEWPKAPGVWGSQPAQMLYRVEMVKPRDFVKILEEINGFTLSHDAGKLLYRKGQAWSLVNAGGAPKPDEGRLDLKALEVNVDPHAEWKQIYRESWRIMRDYFYDPNHHGQNIAELERHYGQYLPSITRRSDLNGLINFALGHISVSHMGAGGGDSPQPAGMSGRVGLLGAEYRIDQGRYQFARVHRTGHFTSSNTLLRAPLDQPGMNVKEGEYLLAIDGKEITADKNIYSYFEGKAGQAVKLTIGPKPALEGARTITAIATFGEQGLMRDNWAQRNRRRVEEMSGGKLGYIYVPSFGGAGLEDFLRGIYGYRDNKQGLIIDQRYNGGGTTSDFIIEMLKREPIYYYAFREGDDIPTPTNPVAGPKVLIINERNGSAAETFPFMFKLGQVGTIVGKRTFGAGIGPYVFTPSFLDGGRLQMPNRGAYNPVKGSWDVENYGVTP
ncbi:MAG TPA: S41 family peptidase, partial [Blastocatellia bacterium]|nr:S41 family peptidase [Blastocatellia bacterium]